MGGSVSGATDTFSNCSGTNVSARQCRPAGRWLTARAASQMNAYLEKSYSGASGCLENDPGLAADNLTAQTQRCGNGVLDPLEECDDSGGLFGPKDACCESSSCKLRPGCACAASQV